MTPYPSTHFILKENPDWTDEQKKIAQDRAERRARELTDVCVIYRPDCGCEVEQFVVLDRFPMSPKIMAPCPACDKSCLLEISEPPRFHTEIGGDFTLENLKTSFIFDTWQKPLLESYKRLNLAD